MKRQVRKCVFETNSSSMHSLVILKKSEYFDKDELRKNVWLAADGTWNIWCQDELSFGRSPFECLYSFESKVRYAIASLCAYNEHADEVYKYIVDIVKEVIPECTNILLPSINWSGQDEFYFGNVDEDILTGFLESNRITLKEFLTDKRYVVIVDGDEYGIWNKMKKIGLVDKEKIEKEYPSNID